MEKHTNDTGKMIAALLVGAVIGGALGILFAPAKGSDTRKKIAGATGDFTDGLKDKFEDFLEGMKKEFTAKKEEMQQVAENSQD